MNTVLPPASAGLLLLALATPWSASAANIFCCLDEHGRQSCGDLLPEACHGRAYREISPNGLTVRQIEAPPTPAQRALRAAEDRQRKKTEAAAAEQRRLDQALLQTYGSEADIDIMRQRAEANARAAIKAAEGKMAEARKRRRRFEDEAEFYRKRALPAEVEKGLREADFDIRAQEELIAARRQEMAAIEAKYAADKRRYLELKSGRPAPQ